MKVLIVYYSRTFVTKKFAEDIIRLTQWDAEELKDSKDRSGVSGYMVACKDAFLKKTTWLKPTKKDPKKYDLVLIGTPVWAFTMTPAVRTYIRMYRRDFNNVAFFCTMGGRGGEKTFKEMERECKKKPLARLACTQKEVMQNLNEKKLEKFLEKLNI